ncbi:T9SS type A sorting domain-containing protein [Spirosoma gilvum]
MILRLFVLACLLSIPSFAQTVASYSFPGTPGDQVSQPPTSTDPNITASAITRGSGLTAVTTPAAGADAFNAVGWTSPSQDPTDYFEFTLTPNANTLLNITGIGLSIRRTAGGPPNYLIAYSIGGGAETTIASGTLTNTSSLSVTSSLSITTTQVVRVRVYAWGSTNGGTTFQLNNTLTINGSAPLPVRLLSFTGKALNQTIELNWTTDWEDKNEGFDILKGNSPNGFEKIGFVQGQTTIQQQTTYSFSDADVETGQLYFYQLRQRDIGGSSELSKIIAVRAEPATETNAISVYPNPNVGSFTVSSKNVASSTLALYDASGRIVPVTISPGQTPDALRITSQMPLLQGIYRLHIQSQNGIGRQAINVLID